MVWFSIYICCPPSTFSNLSFICDKQSFGCWSFCPFRHLTFKNLFSQFLTCLYTPPSHFSCLLPVSFLSIFIHSSITPSPLLIPLADPQRELWKWVGLKRERRALLYPARSSLTLLIRSEERKNNTWDRRGFSLSSTSLLFSFITPELFDISLFLSFCRSLDLNVHKPLELQRYTSISIPSSSFFLTVTSYSPVFK